MGKWRRGFALAEMLLVIVVVTCLVLMFTARPARAAGQPLEDLFNWTSANAVGITYCADITKGTSGAGVYWQAIESKHQWLNIGAIAMSTIEPSAGFAVGFNAGKLVEKIKGAPMVYLRHLTFGYEGTWILDTGEYRDGIFVNLIRLDF